MRNTVCFKHYSKTLVAVDKKDQIVWGSSVYTEGTWTFHNSASILVTFWRWALNERWSVAETEFSVHLHHDGLNQRLSSRTAKFQSIKKRTVAHHINLDLQSISNKPSFKSGVKGQTGQGRTISIYIVNLQPVYASHWTVGLKISWITALRIEIAIVNILGPHAVCFCHVWNI